jgi:ligand-binding sensor domain-containing protein
MYTTLFARQNLLLLGSQDGLALYRLENSGKMATLQTAVTELDFVRVQDIQPALDGKSFWIATEDQGVFRMTVEDSGYSLSKTSPAFYSNENVQSVFNSRNICG